MLKLSELPERIDDMLIPTLAIASFIVAAVGFFGVFDISPWLSISKLTLLLVSLVALALGSLAKVLGKQITLVEQQSALKKDVEQVSSSLSNTQSKQEVLESKHNTLEIYIKQALYDVLEERMSTLLRQVDSNLYKVFEGYLSEMPKNFERVVKSNTIKLTNDEMLKYYLTRTLEKYPGATFLATTRPSSYYLWKDNIILDSNKDFISKGGKIKRVVFVEKDVESKNYLNSPAAQKILNEQQGIGVEMYVAVNVFPEDQRFFIVHEDGLIGWETEVNDDGTLRYAEVTTNRQKIQNYLTNFNNLLNNQARLYSPLQPQQAIQPDD